MLTTEAAQDEMAGLAEALEREQQYHELKPAAMYADAGYVTENTLAQAEQNGMELIRSDASRSAQRAVQYRCVPC